MSSETEIMMAIDRFYGMEGSMEEVVRTLDEDRDRTDRRAGVDRRRSDVMTQEQYLIDAQGGWYATMDGLTRLEERQGMMGWYGIIGDGTPWETPADYVAWAIIIPAICKCGWRSPSRHSWKQKSCWWTRCWR